MGAHRANSASAKIIERLSSDLIISRLVTPDARVEGVVNGGWSWVIDTGEWHIGSAHPRKEVAGAPGMFLTFIGADQIELSPDEIPGVNLNWQLEARLKVGAFAPSN